MLGEVGYLNSVILHNIAAFLLFHGTDASENRV